MRREVILENLPGRIKEMIAGMPDEEFERLQEIRIRVNKPLMTEDNMGSRILNHTVTRKDIEDTLELMSESSIYAFIEEIKKGFITVRGGNRVGVCGRVVQTANEITNIKDISGINVRVAKEVLGAADGIIDKIRGYNTLIISPPQCGKTTLLRDIARQLGDKYKIGIVDERGEIAACYRGEAQHNVGQKTDVLDLCPKDLGMVMLLRSMSPDIIITDEIGTASDLEAITQVINSGVKIITSVHGFNLKDVKKRIDLNENQFERIVILSRRNGAGTVEGVIENAG